MVAKLDVGPKGALVRFHKDSFPDLPGLLAYVERLKGTARLRPDSKLVLTRDWADARRAAQRRAAAVAGPRQDHRLSAERPAISGRTSRALRRKA